MRPLFLSIIVLSLALPACREATEPPSPVTPPSTFTPRPTNTVTLTSIITPTPLPWWLAPRPTDMESYGLIYDPNATPDVPPTSSVIMPIWGYEIPFKLIEGIPQFAANPPPEALADPRCLLEAAGCQVSEQGYAECPPESPLAVFGCRYIDIPAGVYPDLGTEWLSVGTCYTPYEDEFQPRQEYLFRSGCAFRRNVAHIFKVGEEYLLISTPEALRTFFSPIESPEEALAYAQLMTGLPAQFSFEYDDTLLYFQETITGTQVTEMEEGYLLNLFHFQICLCEPWISSQAMIRVSHLGEITWLEAIPLWMTTGFSCAD